jgi:hypothetical protein
MELEKKSVQIKETGQIMNINADEFDAELHDEVEIIEEDVETPSAPSESPES